MLRWSGGRRPGRGGPGRGLRRAPRPTEFLISSSPFFPHGRGAGWARATSRPAETELRRASRHLPEMLRPCYPCQACNRSIAGMMMIESPTPTSTTACDPARSRWEGTATASHGQPQPRFKRRSSDWDGTGHGAVPSVCLHLLPVGAPRLGRGGAVQSYPARPALAVPRGTRRLPATKSDAFANPPNSCRIA